MAKDAIIFDIKYTPYKLKKGSTGEEIKRNKEEREFYDMTGDKNVYKYIATEGKRISKITALEYLEKNTGVFNQNGMLSDKEVSEIKERAKNNKGHIWHGFISLSEKDSSAIDTPEKCISLVKYAFNGFLPESGFNKKNIDLFCALHTDRPKHLHIHFVFFEKEAKSTNYLGDKKLFRSKGNIPKEAIDNMYVRIAEFINHAKEDTYTYRKNAIKELRELVKFRNINMSNETILNEIISLHKDLPKTGRLSYGSKEMEPFRGRVDNIVSMLLDNNRVAQDADYRFYEALEKRRRLIHEYCNQPYKYANGKSIDDIERNSKYRYKIDEKNIEIIEKVKEDYKRRQGNLILNLAKRIDAEYYERNKNRKYKTDSYQLRKRMRISTRKVQKIFDDFLNMFGPESLSLERDCSNRLQEIEEEIKREREKNNKEEEYSNEK